MRLYYFTGPQFALENVEKRHLKISFSTTVNDLFELKPFDFGDRKIRQAWQMAINEHSKTQGFISFSKSWEVPTMWAHYAANHQGVCYGFDVESPSLIKIDYEKKLRSFDPRALTAQSANDREVRYASRTKSAHWSYEDEWRQYVTLNEHEQAKRAGGGEVFLKFSDALVLREVLIGARSAIKSEEFRRHIRSMEKVDIRTVRPSFRAYKIVEQKLSSLQN